MSYNYLQMEFKNTNSLCEGNYLDITKSLKVFKQLLGKALP